ncbi:IS1595 family transposase [Candidatus Brocadia sinica]|nr:IS1595 family transposase [Candidatus Brocadia sinica]MBL1170646.1 IS1595 family transposase [Candidatus Brocadia sp. AMX1]NOG43133.1 IS1595 family transposase [Planctomycetota bacterium]
MCRFEFQTKYQTEDDCEKRLFEHRWPQGFAYPSCGHQEYYHVTKRKLYQCKKCRHQTSLTAGTVMHNTRTSLLLWLCAIYLTSMDKRGFSALSLSKRLGLSYWKAWTMLRKIRHAMKSHDSTYQLTGIVEINDSFFGSSTKGSSNRGRDTSKTAVIVEASTHGDAVGFAKMTVVDKVDSATIDHLVKVSVRGNRPAKTDGLPVYTIVSKSGHNHIQEIVKSKNAHKVLKWTHILISNAKSFIMGTFHRFGKKHLQAYLNEFCYRFNRRKWELQLFDRLVIASVNSQAIYIAELTQ